MKLGMTQDAFANRAEIETQKIINALRFNELSSSQRVIVVEILNKIAWLLESPELSDNILNIIKLIADLERGQSDE